MHILSPGFLRVLRRQDAEFADVVEKWAPKIRGIAASIRKTTNDNEEDIAQAMVEAIAASVAEYRKKQVRYVVNNTVQIWDVIQYLPDGLEAGRGGIARVFKMDEVMPISKAALSTFVFERMVQHCADVYARFFKRGKGFMKTAPEPDAVVFSKAKRRLVAATRSKYVRVAYEDGARDIGDGDGVVVTELDLAEAGEDFCPDARCRVSEILTALEQNLNPKQFAIVMDLIGYIEVDDVDAAWRDASPQVKRVRRAATRRAVLSVIADTPTPYRVSAEEIRATAAEAVAGMFT